MDEYTLEERTKGMSCPICKFWHSAKSCPPENKPIDHPDFISRLRKVVERMDIEIARNESSSDFVDGYCDGMMTARRYIDEDFPELNPKEVGNE